MILIMFIMMMMMNDMLMMDDFDNLDYGEDIVVDD